MQKIADGGKVRRSVPSARDEEDGRGHGAGRGAVESKTRDKSRFMYALLSDSPPSTRLPCRPCGWRERDGGARERGARTALMRP
jgi:hypothetical protein